MQSRSATAWPGWSTILYRPSELSASAATIFPSFATAAVAFAVPTLRLVFSKQSPCLKAQAAGCRCPAPRSALTRIRARRVGRGPAIPRGRRHRRPLIRLRRGARGGARGEGTRREAQRKGGRNAGSLGEG